ncbi:hypothetical protein AALP_AAs67262U000500 [Arabis alpina]|uniref:Uncharacterized protein n=1 Tax=Arabis alpina TaxID=50452 RepID=A0A087FX70_ARAAL|nr:hypothetical protein AALP_AAs67262U000500 [Arabis alpina]
MVVWLLLYQPLLTRTVVVTKRIGLCPHHVSHCSPQVLVGI